MSPGLRYGQRPGFPPGPVSPPIGAPVSPPMYGGYSRAAPVPMYSVTMCPFSLLEALHDLECLCRLSSVFRACPPYVCHALVTRCRSVAQGEGTLCTTFLDRVNPYSSHRRLATPSMLPLSRRAPCTTMSTTSQAHGVPCPLITAIRSSTSPQSPTTSQSPTTRYVAFLLFAPLNF
jgi:hypothetical protein